MQLSLHPHASSQLLIAPGEDDHTRLHWIAKQILDPDHTLADTVPSICALTSLLEQRTILDFSIEDNLKKGESLLPTGKAVSPIVAALCAREVYRTSAFIRGLGKAITDAMSDLPTERPVRVLYAGCGPFALQALPLMTIFSPNQVQFTLIDIHSSSLDCVRHLLNGFGFSGHVSEFLCIDATLFQITEQPDVIVSETMNVCLGKEPQVAIARHLLKQAPHARMVPQSVQIDACLLHPAKEFARSEAASNSQVLARERIHLGRVFALNSETIQSWSEIKTNKLPAESIRIPQTLEKKHQFNLLTKIVVYDDVVLNDYDSSLTAPQRLPGKIQLQGGETLQFHYELGPNPKLSFTLVEQSSGQHLDHLYPTSFDLLELSPFWPRLRTLWQRLNQVPTSTTAITWHEEIRALSAMNIAYSDLLKFLYEKQPSEQSFKTWLLQQQRAYAPFELKEQLTATQGLSEADLSFWQENGYLVIKGVIDKARCVASAQAILDCLGARLEEPESWYQTHPLRSGIMLNFTNHSMLNANRESVRIRRIFEQLYNNPSLFRIIAPVGFNPPETDTHKFSGSPLHWDTSLELPIRTHLQGMLYLTDCDQKSGAFHCVPGFQHRIESWLSSLPVGANPRECARDQLQQVPVEGEAGDLVIWHQALPHCATPNRGRLPRIVQYLTYLPDQSQDPTVWH